MVLGAAGMTGTVAVAAADTGVAVEAEACTLAGAAVPEAAGTVVVGTVRVVVAADTGAVEDTVEEAEVGIGVDTVEAGDILAVPGRAGVHSTPVLVSFSELHK